jgi:hypothetical protein
MASDGLSYHGLACVALLASPNGLFVPACFVPVMGRHPEVSVGLDLRCLVHGVAAFEFASKLVARLGPPIRNFQLCRDLKC